MKRTILAVILIFALLICLPACTTTDSNQKVYDLLTGYAAINPDSYRIEVTVTGPNGYKATTLYTVTTDNGVRTVATREEKLNGFIVDGEITAPESYVTVTEGTLSPEESANRDDWGVTVIGEKVTIGKGATVAAKEMIDTDVKGVK